MSRSSTRKSRRVRHGAQAAQLHVAKGDTVASSRRASRQEGRVCTSAQNSGCGGGREHLRSKAGTTPAVRAASSSFPRASRIQRDLLDPKSGTPTRVAGVMIRREAGGIESNPPPSRV